jgi:hypothetical protein
MNRRGFLVLAAAVGGLGGRTTAQEATVLSEADPKAKALHYVEDAAKSAGDPTHLCSSCGLYQGDSKSAQGPCLLFPKYLVKASGTCSSWAPQM